MVPGELRLDPPAAFGSEATAQSGIVRQRDHEVSELLRRVAARVERAQATRDARLDQIERDDRFGVRLIPEHRVEAARRYRAFIAQDR